LWLRIRACAARPVTAKCGGAKPHKGRKPDCGFAEPEPPIGGEQLPFVRRSGVFTQLFFPSFTILFHM